MDPWTPDSYALTRDGGAARTRFANRRDFARARALQPDPLFDGRVHKAVTPPFPDVEWVVVDVEAGGLFADDGARVGSVGIGWLEGDQPRAVAWPFDQGERDKFPHMQMDLLQSEDPNLSVAEWSEFLDWLSGRGIVCHNAKYDLAMVEAGTRLAPGRRLLENLRWDTLLAQRQLDPTERGGLELTGERLGLGRKVSNELLKAWLKKHGYPTHRYDLVPWHLIEPYLLGDVELTLRLYQLQAERVHADQDGVLDRMHRELELTKVLYRMEARGIGYDHATSLEAADELERRANKLELAMPFQCDINSAKAWFFGHEGLLPDRRTDKGAPSLDEEQVRTWVGEGVEWASEYDQVNKMRRAISMWYRGYPEKAGPDGRLRTYYKQAHVKSGRMSVQRVQLQAIPKADKALEGVPMVRELLRAQEGCGLWNIDLQQAELRVAAKYSGCQTVLRMLEEGVDFHGETTKTVLRVPPSDPLWKEKRDIAKRLNFGAIFQIGGEKFQATLAKLADIHLPLDECDMYVRQWRSTYPEFGRAYYKAMRFFEQRGYVYLLPRTPYQMRSFRGPEDYPNTGWNRVVQGSLAEFMKLWLVELDRRWPDRIVLTIHDSIVVEAPLDEGDEVSREIIDWTVPFASEIFRTPMACDVGRWA